MQTLKSRTEVLPDLFRVVGRFRRQIRRSVGRGLDSARLTQAQAELLWLGGRQPGISVSAAAAELGLVANTASTLVSKLVSGGLLARSVSATDRRVCELALAEPTQQIVDASRAARRSLLYEVIGDLNDDQIESLAKGLEVLETMTQLLQERRS